MRVTVHPHTHTHTHTTHTHIHTTLTHAHILVRTFNRFIHHTRIYTHTHALHLTVRLSPAGTVDIGQTVALPVINSTQTISGDFTAIEVSQPGDKCVLAKGSGQRTGSRFSVLLVGSDACKSGGLSRGAIAGIVGTYVCVCVWRQSGERTHARTHTPHTHIPESEFYTTYTQAYTPTHAHTRDRTSANATHTIEQ